MVFKLFLEIPLFLLNKRAKELLTPWNTFFQFTYNQNASLIDIDLSLYDDGNDEIQFGKIKLSTHKFTHGSKKLMSDIYWKTLKTEFRIHPSELGPENRSIFFSLKAHYFQIFICGAQ